MVLAGLVGCLLTHKYQWEISNILSAGGLIIVAAFLAEKIPSWRHMALQIATLMNLGVIFFCGLWFALELGVQGQYEAGSFFIAMFVVYVVLKSAFITSTAFQDEFADQDDVSADTCRVAAKDSMPGQAS